MHHLTRRSREQRAFKLHVNNSFHFVLDFCLLLLTIQKFLLSISMPDHDDTQYARYYHGDR